MLAVVVMGVGGGGEIWRCSLWFKEDCGRGDLRKGQVFFDAWLSCTHVCGILSFERTPIMRKRTCSCIMHALVPRLIKEDTFSLLKYFLIFRSMFVWVVFVFSQYSYSSSHQRQQQRRMQAKSTLPACPHATLCPPIHPNHAVIHRLELVHTPPVSYTHNTHPL